jgi:hypothetical protein
MARREPKNEAGTYYDGSKNASDVHSSISGDKSGGART